MEISEFKAILKDIKPTSKQTPSFYKDLQITKKKDMLVLSAPDELCSSCGRKSNPVQVCIEFKDEIPRLSIFEAGLIWALWVENQKPFDYGNFHKCKAGKEFIDSLHKLTVKR